ncbi:nuclear transport factor 2 family protein [Pontimicrobium sp. MEBiC06410]
MVRIITIIVVLIANIITAQVQVDEKVAVKQTIETFFEGFHKGDTTLMKSVMMGKFTTQTAYKNKAGKDMLVTDNSTKLIETIGKRPADQKWDERLLDFKIRVDGNMANAWTPYEFWFNGNFLHCGVNSFQLFKDNGTWKIIYLIDTRRKKGCKE